jgi:hypothetical protein
MDEKEAHAWRVLCDHKGRPNAIPMKRLAELLEVDDREVRTIVNNLIIRHGKPVMSYPGFRGGYFIVESPEEYEDACRAMRRRALAGLAKVRAWQGSTLAEETKQMVLEFDEDAGADTRSAQEEPGQDAVPVGYQVVTNLIDHMAGDPEKYAVQLDSLRKRLGPLFISRRLLEEMLAKTREAEASAEKMKALNQKIKDLLATIQGGEAAA